MNNFKRNWPLIFILILPLYLLVSCGNSEYSFPSIENNYSIKVKTFIENAPANPLDFPEYCRERINWQNGWEYKETAPDTLNLIFDVKVINCKTFCIILQNIYKGEIKKVKNKDGSIHSYFLLPNGKIITNSGEKIAIIDSEKDIWNMDLYKGSDNN